MDDLGHERHSWALLSPSTAIPLDSLAAAGMVVSEANACQTKGGALALPNGGF